MPVRDPSPVHDEPGEGGTSVTFPGDIPGDGPRLVAPDTPRHLKFLSLLTPPFVIAVTRREVRPFSSYNKEIGPRRATQK